VSLLSIVQGGRAAVLKTFPRPDATRNERADMSSPPARRR
jgi:hypothetical protein